MSTKCLIVTMFLIHLLLIKILTQRLLNMVVSFISLWKYCANTLMIFQEKGIVKILIIFLQLY